jgi:hypothetical protein
MQQRFLLLCFTTLALFFGLLSFGKPINGSKNISPHHGFEVITDPQTHPQFFDMMTNLPETWSLWAEDNLSKENLNNIYFLTAMTAATVATDYETWQAFKKPHEKSNDLQVFNYHMVSAGDGFFQVSLAGLWGLYGWGASDNRALRTSSQIMEAILSTGAVVQIMKHATGRESPFQTSTRTGNWEPFPEQVKYHKNVQKYDAVPSGHIATAHATFIVIWENYPEYKWIPYVGYPLISFIASGLVGTSLHWWSDIPLGIALGHSFAKVVTRKNEKSSLGKQSIYTPDIVPIFNSKRGNPTLMGLRWQW